MTPAAERLQWVDVAKGVGILLVVYGHVQQGLYLAGMKVPQCFFYAERIIYSFHMPLFFFLSGIFAEKSLSKGRGVFVWDKIKVLLYPYFLWSLLHGGIQVILSPYTNDKLTVVDLFKTIYIPIAHFWFLQALFFSCVFYALLKKYLPIYAILIIAASMYIGKFFLDPGPVHNISRMFLFFVAGSLFSFISYKIQKGIGAKALLLIGALFILFHVAVFHFDITDVGLVKLAAVIVGIAFVISLSIHYQYNPASNIIGQLGFLAMPIYLGHVIGLAATRIVLLKVFHVEDVFIHLLTGCIAGIAFPVLLFIAANRLGFYWLFTLSRKSALTQPYTSYAFRQQML